MEDIEALKKKYTFKNRKPKVQRTREEYLSYRKELYLKNKERIKSENKKWRDKNEQKDKEYRKRYKQENKDLIKKAAKEYIQKNKETIAIKNKDRRSKDLVYYNARQKELRANRTPEQKTKEAEYRKQYRAKNKDKLKAYREERKDILRANKRVWHHKKYREDILYKITHNLRSRVKQAIRCGLKTEKTITLLGCTTSQLKTHIESLFTEGMNWEVFMTGDIHVDHIKPCSKFDLTKRNEQRACFNYKNLQPLWWYDNLAKSDNYEEQKVA